LTPAGALSITRARSVIVGTAGHIDHGKTALIRALTGIDTDRLPEEKRRGITIDLGFASLQLQAQDGSALQISFIDVPGHARFVRNMLAGTGGVDAVLMVISAEEGVKPQTQEHLAICSLLGIERGIAVLTKSDAVSEERLLDVTEDVRCFLRDTFLATAPLIAVSAHTGSGISSLRREMIRMTESVSPRSPGTVVRLPIDRVFVMNGFGTVVTGTLIGGSIRAGDELAVEPGGRVVRVRGVQVHGCAEEMACAGSRTALNLARIEAGDLTRGDTLVAPDGIAAIDTVDVELTVLPGAPALKHRARVHFHAYAAECVTTATLHKAVTVKPGETKLARLKLARPIVLLPGDRFVLRQGSPVTTTGGGSVLDCHPILRTRKPKTAEWLQQLRAASAGDQICLRVARRGVAGIAIKELSSETGWIEIAIRDLIGAKADEGRLHVVGDRRVLSSESLTAARKAILQPLRLRGVRPAGVKRPELKEQVGLEPEVFDEVLRQLEQDRELRIAGEVVMAFDAASASVNDRSLLPEVAAEFGRAGVTPPSPEELGSRLGIAPAEMRRLITLLLRQRTLIRLGSDSLCMDRRAIEELAGRMRTLRGQKLDVAAFKQLAGVSRKYAIPLLEYFDRQRVTVKQGDQRLVL
jgi:selenocysteine-specific elongation factor